MKNMLEEGRVLCSLETGLVEVTYFMSSFEIRDLVFRFTAD
jgi:hypothetical protein